MPPQRTQNYKHLSAIALICGIEMSPCSYCVKRSEREKRQIRCVVSKDDSSRCVGCIENKKGGCDVSGPSDHAMKKLLDENDRLDREEEETLSKLLRLRRQRREFSTRARDMLRRGLKTLDELDEAEEKERLAKEEEVRRLAAAGSPVSSGTILSEEVDLAAILGLNDFEPDPSFWATVDFDGGTRQASQGS